MLPVGRKPVIQHVVEEIVSAGIAQLLIVTSQQKRAIEDHFDGDWLGLNGSRESSDVRDEPRLHYTRQNGI